jgi:hypothetical protein
LKKYKMAQAKSKMNPDQSILVMPNVATAELMFRLYYTNQDDDNSDMSKTMEDALAWLANHHMIDEGGPTDRGRYWVEHVVKIPLPILVKRFQIPESVESND